MNNIIWIIIIAITHIILFSTLRMLYVARGLWFAAQRLTFPRGVFRTFIFNMYVYIIFLFCSSAIGTWRHRICIENIRRAYNSRLEREYRYAPVTQTNVKNKYEKRLSWGNWKKKQIEEKHTQTHFSLRIKKKTITEISFGRI